MSDMIEGRVSRLENEVGALREGMAALRSDMNGITQTTTRILTKVEELTGFLGPLTRLEERHHSQAQSVSRAHARIDELTREWRDHLDDEEKTHEALAKSTSENKALIEKYRNMALGIAATASIAWFVLKNINLAGVIK